MRKLLALLLLLALPAQAQILTTSNGTPLVTSNGSPFNVGMKWQGMGQGMQQDVQGTNSSTILSNTNRTRHYTNTAFEFSRAVISLTFPSGAVTATPSAPQPSGSTLTFSTMPLVGRGMVVTDVTNSSAIPANTTLTSCNSTTATLSATVTGVLTTDTIKFDNNPAGTVKDRYYDCAQSTLNFQVGLEPTYTAGLTGIPARKPYLWNGHNYYTYTYTGSGPAYVVSDILDAGQSIGVGTSNFFGLHTTVECASSMASCIPEVMNGTNYLQRYIGTSTSTSSQIAALGGSSDVALTATSYSIIGSAFEGYAAIYTPAFLLIEVPTATKMVAGAACDSVGYGVGEGVLGSWAQSTNYQYVSGVGDEFQANVYSGGGVYQIDSSTPNCTSAGTGTGPTGTGTLITDGTCKDNFVANPPGDAMGDQYSNMGYIARYVEEYAGINWTGLCRGGDRMQFLATYANGFGRYSMFGIMNPTDDLVEDEHNDISAGTPVATLFGYAKTVTANLHNLAPQAKLYIAAVEPSDTTTDNFRTATNQTPLNPGWNGAPTSVRDVWDNNYVRADGGLHQTGFIDPNPVVEYNYTEGGTPTDKWIFNGNQFSCTEDGVHIISACTASASASLYVSTPF